MTLMNRIMNSLLKLGIRLLFKVDDSELKQIPQSGPMIIIANHITFYEAPIYYLFLRPRRTIALAKKELWNSFVTRKLMEWWETIPVVRGAMDREAMRKSFQVLDEGNFFCVAPEGTRSRSGKLKQGKAGTAFIAIKKPVPILPIAHYGIQQFSRNIRRLRRTRFVFRVGQPFVIKESRRFSSEERQQITDEMMRRLAQLLPEDMRGYYADSMDEPFICTEEVPETESE